MSEIELNNLDIEEYKMKSDKDYLINEDKIKCYLFGLLDEYDKRKLSFSLENPEFKTQYYAKILVDWKTNH